jgi:hypothetical protein
MNIYSQLLNYFKALGDADTFVNTITQGDFDKIDLDKGQLHPLLHIQINNGSFPSESVVVFNVQIGCFDNRDINKEIVEDRFWKQDNEVDNLNETMAVLNRLYFKMLQDFTDENISVTQTATLEQVTEWNQNLIDGWLMTFTIELPNSTISLCS